MGTTPVRSLNLFGSATGQIVRHDSFARLRRHGPGHLSSSEEKSMRKTTVAAMAVVASVMFLIIGSASAKGGRTFTGEIMDSMCAASGSHAAMLKMSSMPNADPND